MNTSDWLFWNVDTQFDFVSPYGKLYVPGAELLKYNWAKLTQLAKDVSITVVNTADWHYPNSEELSSNPDYITTFPLHCMANNQGAEFIKETFPENPFIIDWDKEMVINHEQSTSGKYRNFVIRKDAFDVFKGNRYTEKLLKQLSPETVVVYGVTTNVCVNDAVIGLAKRVKSVIVVENAVKELPNIPLPFENWKKLGVEMRSLDEVIELLRVDF
jgi:nicotinamidase/pyrazinamidase